METIVLYIHIMAATAWIGGGILLFGLGIFVRDNERKNTIYSEIGPFYGYFESVWLIILIASGYWLLKNFGLDLQFCELDSNIGQIVTYKVLLVIFLSILTAIHLLIAFKTLGKNRSNLQMFVSRASSMAIFILNFVILWYAIALRSAL
jgi:uncharacterized membrane protein